MSLSRFFSSGRAASNCVAGLLRPSSSSSPGLSALASASLQNDSPRSRPLTVPGRSYSAKANGTKFFTKDESREFLAVFPDLVRQLTIEGPHKDVPDVNKHLSRSLQYNVPTGKRTRGLAVPVTYKILTPEADQTEENLQLAYIMGWCMELLQAFFLVADDVMDNSKERRGQPCWFRKPDVGLNAINDAILLEASIYTLLENNFREQPYYLRCVHAFHKTTRHTSFGQSLDMLTSQLKNEDGTIQLNMFDMKRYAAIVRHKTSYYSFFLPVALGMNLAGFTDTERYRQAQTILLEMGHFFQVQDDYLDCFGDPKVTGKVGRDIQEGKCSWLIVIAMQRANKEQKQELQACYGSEDPDKVERVKSIYQDLKLPKVFKTYEAESHRDILTHISMLPGEGKVLPPKLFTIFLDRIYKRDS